MRVESLVCGISEADGSEPGRATRYDLSPPGPAAVMAPAFGARIQLRNYYPGEYSWSMLPVMSVPLTLLGLLERGPSHGYDLGPSSRARAYRSAT
jgi:hypothetical protein